MTFSLSGRCARTGTVGIVISSSSPAVAARCAFVRAGVGAAASQNVTDPRLGTRMLDLLEQGLAADDAVKRLVAEEPLVQHRQLACVDTAGGTGGFSGTGTLGIHAVFRGVDCVAAGNLLATPFVPERMEAAFAADPSAHLADRLLGALRAGLDAGGEAGPVRSAGLLVADRVPWPVVDLRVDWDEDPITRLEELWRRYAPEAEAYVTRALDPASAPGYGVPGDDRPV